MRGFYALTAFLATGCDRMYDASKAGFGRSTGNLSLQNRIFVLWVTVGSGSQA
jgi:hypothetical protein